jgi:putative hydrolase of the HAD superfamily
MRAVSSRFRAVFLDAGNTLLFPRLDVVAQAVTALGYPAAVADLQAAERAGKARLDEWLWPQIRRRQLPPSVDVYYWGEFLGHLLDRLQVPDDARPAVLQEVSAHFREIRLWSSVEPSTAPYLAALGARGYFLGVISNSIGTMEQQLERLGLAQYFQIIFDSALVGVEKPHPEIFRMALRRSGFQASQAVFVGDTYSTDVGGAQLAGLTGVLMDRVGAYPHAPCPRITSLPELDQFLEETPREEGYETEAR